MKKLKEKVEKIELTKETQKKLVKLFISHLANIFEMLNEKLPFYFENYTIKKKETNENNNHSNESLEILEIQNELKNKNEFLMDIGFRINEIYKKLI